MVMTIVMTMERKQRTTTYKASEFKARCLKIMDEVEATGAPVVITKNGRPVAQLVPFGNRLSTLAGAHKGQIEITGDITAPLDLEWDAAK